MTTCACPPLGSHYAQHSLPAVCLLALSLAGGAIAETIPPPNVSREGGARLPAERAAGDADKQARIAKSSRSKIRANL
jgi:hypothetical protein